MSKREFGVNGEHDALGREFSMHEFKGFMVAKVSDIEKKLENHDKRICENREDIQGVKVKAAFFGGILGVIGGFFGKLF